MKALALIALLLLSLITTAATEVPVFLHQDYNLVKEVDYLLDETNSLGLEELLQSNEWKAFDRKMVNFGFIKPTLWLRFKVVAQEEGDWVLHTTYPLLDFFESTGIINGRMGKTIYTGDLVDFSNRPINNPGFVFPYSLSKGDVLEVYLKIKTEGAAEVPLMFRSLASFNESEGGRHFMWGWANAVLIVMFFYNLFIFFIVRERVYFFYVLCVFFNTFGQGIFDGTWFQYIWPNTPHINNMMFPFFNGLMHFASLLFITEFLQIFKRDAWYKHYFKYLLICMASFPILSFFVSYQLIMVIEVLGALIMHSSGLLIGLYLSFKGETLAKLFTLAWSLFMLGNIVANLKGFGLLPSNWFTIYATQIGTFVEITILSMALAYRIEAVNKEKAAAQRESIKNLKRYQNLYRESLSGQFQLADDGRLVSVNPAFYKMLGYDSEQELLSLPRETRIEKLNINVEKFRNYLDELKQHDNMMSFETKLTSKNEGSRWYSISMMGVKEESGDVKYFEGSMISINELKENEEIKLNVIKDRMGALEHLVVGVCHEMNTPLGVATTGLSYLVKGNEELSEIFQSGELTKDKFSELLKDESEAIALIEENLNRLNVLIKKFRDISILQRNYELQDFKFKMVIEEQLVLHEALLKNVSVVVECAEDLCVNSYPKAISDMLAQFIENSVHHGFIDCESSEITIAIKRSSDALTIHYADNGKGISLEKQKDIFNPFYTTRRGSSENIGLGMFQVYNIVTQLLNGEISVSDESGGFGIMVSFPLDRMS